MSAKLAQQEMALQDTTPQLPKFKSVADAQAYFDELGAEQAKWTLMKFRRRDVEELRAELSNL